MRKRSNRQFRWAACAVLLGAAAAALPAGAASADASPASGIVFVGLVAGEWRLFLLPDGGTAQPVATATEPRTPSYSARLARIAYISADGALREIDLRSGQETVVLRPTATLAYTQPAYRPRTDELYVVALRDRSSVETDIGRVDRAAGKVVTVLAQRSAQFEPSFTADGARMLYANVACASECPKIIQEIWSMEMVGGVAEQMTLLNAVARQPVSDRDGSVVFASNRAGSYQLWRLQPGTPPVALTTAQAVDESPAVNDRGEMYFVRRTPAGGRLMRMSAAGQLAAVELGAAIGDVRDVRWGQP